VRKVSTKRLTVIEMRHPRRFVTLAPLVSFALLVNGFAPSTVWHSRTTLRHDRRRTTLSAASAGEKEPDNLRTLYDVLGASKTDSYQTLRLKYTTLARKMHPDANPNTVLDVSEFTEVVAAWRVLADPKERLKYDRSLKAKEFTDSMERFIDFSIQNAIPFMKKTANTTMSAVETSSKTINQVSQRMGVAMDLLELDRKVLSLEQQ